MALIMLDPLKGASPSIQQLSSASRSSGVRITTVTPHDKKHPVRNVFVNDTSVNFLLLHFRVWGLHKAMPVDSLSW